MLFEVSLQKQCRWYKKIIQIKYLQACYHICTENRQYYKRQKLLRTLMTSV